MLFIYHNVPKDYISPISLADVTRQHSAVFGSEQVTQEPDPSVEETRRRIAEAQKNLVGDQQE